MFWGYPYIAQDHRPYKLNDVVCIGSKTCQSSWTTTPIWPCVFVSFFFTFSCTRYLRLLSYAMYVVLGWGGGGSGGMLTFM